MNTFNYDYIKTPIIEASELFHRTVGETTDIVTKETYDFTDRGNRNITLRPEGTAGVVRSFIENKLYADNGIKKLWYFGDMFRYERPQSGRYREFTQFGCEAFGSDDPMLDAEIISIPVILFEMLGLKGVKVKVNTLGDATSRENYKKALLEYFKPHIDELCEDCKNRYLKNPLRILDCKVDKDSEVLKHAPRTVDYLTEDASKHFDEVLKYLGSLDIDYEVDTRIIRGLDYYTHTVFEIEASIEEFGAQNVLCAGGRYDNLVKNLDGPETKGVGFALGLERLMLALEYEKKDDKYEKGIDTYLIYLNSLAKEKAFEINHMLRLMGFRSDIDYLNKNIKSNLKQAEKLNANFVIILGEDEINGNYLTVRNMYTKEEKKIKNQELIDFLDENLINDEKIDDCDCDKCNCSDEDSCNCKKHESE